MKLSEHKDLKAEILALSTKEKDKLLLRLIARDKVLTAHLHFLLLENETDLEERTQLIKEEILILANYYKTVRMLSAKEVLTSLRKKVSVVNYFYKVTKASFEEVLLKVFLLNHTPTIFKKQLFYSSKNDEFLLGNYFIRQTLAIVKKYNKLHEDLQYDLNADLNKLLTKAHQGNMAVIAQDFGLPQQIKV